MDIIRPKIVELYTEVKNILMRNNKKSPVPLFLTNNTNLTRGGMNYSKYSDYTFKSAYKLAKHRFLFDTEFNNNSNHVIIFGAGPIGLFMAISIKKIMPEIEVVIYESRATENQRKLERRQIVNVFPNFGIYKSDIQKFTKRSPLSTSASIVPGILELSTLDFRSILYDLLTKFKINDYGDDVVESYYITDINGESIFGNYSINQIEFILSKQTETLGIKIIHKSVQTKDECKKLINANTICIFDATGGRLPFNVGEFSIQVQSKKCNYVAGVKKQLKPKYECDGTELEQYCISTKTDFYNVRCKDANDATFDDTSNICAEISKDPKDKHVQCGVFDYSVKEFNIKKDIVMINGCPILNIGESFRSLSFVTGANITYSAQHCIICASIIKYILSQIQAIPNEVDTDSSDLDSLGSLTSSVSDDAEEIRPGLGGRRIKKQRTRLNARTKKRHVKNPRKRQPKKSKKTSKKRTKTRRSKK